MKKVLILGSGGLKIGQAGEFDYSGSQAIKALKEEGHKTYLINPNIATVQTDPSMADKLFLEPLTVDSVKKILSCEKPTDLLLNVGGQTALNLGLELEESGLLKQYNVNVLGTSIETIRITECRQAFKEALTEVSIKTAKSITVYSLEEALKAADEIGFPVMVRSGYSLGGLGSGKVTNRKELKNLAEQSLCHAPHILIEEYLQGWKEIEYEIVRDQEDNCITVCNMENFDPMGIHTGESIVIAPSQTLTNEEYHKLRLVAIKAASHLNIIGECNIQYALNPENGDYRVIEMNARLSRSSALASKATGYPLAFVATKLCLGKTLPSIKNSITKKTSAFFEPALDYVVVKMPRWDIKKLSSAERNIGSEMKSVGEVMAIGKSFKEALQKAVRMLNIGASGLTCYPDVIPDPLEETIKATDRRLFAISMLMAAGKTIEEIHQLTSIDPFFLQAIDEIVHFKQNISLTAENLLQAKQNGFSDYEIAKHLHCPEVMVRQKRKEFGIIPAIKQIDTLAGEFDAETNYLYLTYHGNENDIAPSKQKPYLVIGSGPYCIGSSVEFDWCAVNALRSLRQFQKTTLLINCNPETVSTDYDESDRLYFEELTLERVLDITDFEDPEGVIVSVGGQIANTLARPLEANGLKLMGSSATSIDQAENRQIFSSTLQKMGIDQPQWCNVTSYEQALEFIEKVNYPVLIRPSYVLSGAAMQVIFNENSLKMALEKAVHISKDHPVVLTEFILNAKEIEIDGIAKNGEIILDTITEHIENAGVHSGDATVVLPPQRLNLETIRESKKIARQIVCALNLTGPFNIQLLAKANALKVIECNARAARSFPFVSKTTKINFMEECIKIYLNKPHRERYQTLELDYVAVKSPQFSYGRLKGANPVPHVEMASTGEVACMGENLSEAFFKSWQATGQKLSGKRVLVSIGGDKKEKLLSKLQDIDALGWTIYTTKNTHHVLAQNGIGTHFLHKASVNMSPNVIDIIKERKVDLLINIPHTLSRIEDDQDGFMIRRLAIDFNIPLITNIHVALAFLQAVIEQDHLHKKNLCTTFV